MVDYLRCTSCRGAGLTIYLGRSAARLPRRARHGNHSPCGVESFRHDFQEPRWLLDDEEQARTLSDNVFIPLSATLVILQLLVSNRAHRNRTMATFRSSQSSRCMAGTPHPAPRRLCSTRCPSVRCPSASIGKSATSRTQEGGRQERASHVPVRSQNSWRPRPADFFRAWRQFQHPTERRLAIQAHAVGDGRRLVHSLRRVFQDERGFPGQPSIKLGFEGGSEDNPFTGSGKKTARIWNSDSSKSSSNFPPRSRASGRCRGKANWC